MSREAPVDSGVLVAADQGPMNIKLRPEVAQLPYQVTASALLSIRWATSIPTPL
jgi:hypothetical protein